jgi:hypothetical protein
VVAHEMWHAIEAAMPAVDRRRHFAFRVALGEAFGVRTFEHVYRAGRGTSGAEQVAAFAQLRSAVGDYATTSPAEGTAELFKHWWVLVREEQLVRRFAELVEEHWPTELA